MGRAKKRKPPRRIGQSHIASQSRLAAIKTTWTSQDGETHADYQIAPIPLEFTFEEMKAAMLEMAQAEHPDEVWTVDIYDPDNMPLDDSIPEGTSFRVREDQPPLLF